MKNIFDQEVNNTLINRINKLSYTSQPEWGKMNVAQMLAHCCVTYELIYESQLPPNSGLVRFMMKLFVKKIVVGDKPYRKNSRTAPAFLIVDERNFELEKKRLIGYMNKTQQLGSGHFEGKVSHSFGNLSAKEWSNMFYKHLDHHLTQFGV